MIKLLRGLVFTLLVVAVGSYVGDWAVYKLRGSPKAKLTVHQFISAPLKNKRQMLDYVGSEEMPCAVALMPQSGLAPCWYLRRHTNQVNTY